MAEQGGNLSERTKTIREALDEEMPPWMLDVYRMRTDPAVKLPPHVPATAELPPALLQTCAITGECMRNREYVASLVEHEAERLGALIVRHLEFGKRYTVQIDRTITTDFSGWQPRHCVTHRAELAAVRYQYIVVSEPLPPPAPWPRAEAQSRKGEISRRIRAGLRRLMLFYPGRHLRRGIAGAVMAFAPALLWIFGPPPGGALPWSRNATKDQRRRCAQRVPNPTRQRRDSPAWD